MKLPTLNKQSADMQAKSMIENALKNGNITSLENLCDSKTQGLLKEKTLADVGDFLIVARDKNKETLFFIEVENSNWSDIKWLQLDNHVKKAKEILKRFSGKGE